MGKEVNEEQVKDSGHMCGKYRKIAGLGKGTVCHFGKCTYSLVYRVLDEKIHDTISHFVH